MVYKRWAKLIVLGLFKITQQKQNKNVESWSFSKLQKAQIKSKRDY